MTKADRERSYNIFYKARFSDITQEERVFLKEMYDNYYEDTWDIQNKAFAEAVRDKLGKMFLPDIR